MNNTDQQYSSIEPEKGYPVSITQVEELGSSSLYVKWEIADSNGIGGYEVNYLINIYSYFDKF